MHVSTVPLHASPEEPAPGWQVLHGGCHEAPRGRDFPPHAHLAWEWTYYRAGHILCQHGQETFAASPGLLWLTPPRTAHAEIARTAYRNDFILVRGPADAPLPRVCRDDAHGSLGRLCGDIVRELRGSWPDRERMLALLAEQLWRLAARWPGRTPARGPDRVVAAADDCWARNPAAPVAHVARRAGASASTLREHFHRWAGCSPREYRCRQRVRAAMELLRAAPDLTLETVAERCGYDSASHLGRQIKRYTGQPPGRWRIPA